uniref:NADH dehydrogenase subunit 11 n=1 Tax=Vischeria punctata TaxID=643629 RepID=UPI0021AD0D5E|nr:NADH dehydrogenase subunit 11 [Vischeria punctata]UUA03916.1 NADH dehydrogenase subunit 11 [Vischeria punctata]
MFKQILTGALTSKPYSFTSRPWELHTVQSIDVLDGLGSNICIDFKETEISRILPRKNKINDYWITDKIRFFYDGLKRQRLNTPYIKHRNYLKFFKWKKVLTKISSILNVFSSEYGNSKLGLILGSSLDTETYFSARNFKLSCGFYNVSLDYHSNILIDNPNMYKFQDCIKTLENTDYCLLIGTNPRFEASILNLKLRKIYNKGKFFLSSIGSSFVTTFKFNTITLNLTSLYTLSEGKHELCKHIVKAKNPKIIYGAKVLQRFDNSGSYNLLKVLNQNYNSVFLKNFSYNLLHADANVVGGCDVGFESFSRDTLQKLKFVYCIGVENFSFYKYFNLAKVLLVIQNWTGNRNTGLADIILPSTSFIESNGTFYNTEGCPQRSHQVFLGPNLARHNWQIFNVFFYLLSKSSFYTTKAELGNILSKILPSYYHTDKWFNLVNLSTIKNFDFGMVFKEVILCTNLRLIIEDFFMTQNFCYSSPTMAKASGLQRANSYNYGFLKCI